MMRSSRAAGARRRPALRPILAAVLALLPACASAQPAVAGSGAPGTGAAPDPAPSRAGGPAAAQASDYVYVAVQGAAQVAVVDARTLEEVARVELTTLGFSENAKPHHIAVEPDGSHWYVSLIGENRILKFDRENRLVGQTEFEVPGMLAVHPEEDLLFVGRSMSAVNPPQRIGMVTRSDLEVEELDVFFPRPHALAVSADGERVYSASLALNQLGAVDIDTGALELSALEGPIHTLVQFAVSPDGETLVATAQLTGLLLIFDLEDPDRPVLRGQVPVGNQPWHPVFSHDGAAVYFGNKMDDSVVAVEVASGRILWTTTGVGIDHPHGSALSPDGRYLFVSSNGPGGMQMDGMEMGAEEGAGEHAAGHGRDHSEHADAGHHGAHEATATGTLAVLDTTDGRLVKILEMGENATGVGARRP